MKKLFHIHSFSNEKKVQRVLKKYPCFFFLLKKKKNVVSPSLIAELLNRSSVGEKRIQQDFFSSSDNKKGNMKEGTFFQGVRLGTERQ